MSDYVKIPAEAIAELRQVIAWGLYAMGEVERVQNLAALDKLVGKPWAEGATPCLATEHPLAMVSFGSALMWLDCAEEVAE